MATDSLYEQNYNQFLKERQAVLDSLGDIKTKESRAIKALKLKLKLSKQKHKKEGNRHYFSWDFLQLPDLSDIPLRVSIGPRNIGKTWDARRKCEKMNKLGKKWVWIRLKEKNDLDAFILGESNEGGWFDENGWESKGKVIIDKASGETVGYCLALSTMKKGIEYPGIGLIVFDEFAYDRDIGKYVAKFSTVLVTIIRQQADVECLMLSNFDNGENPFLEFLGVPNNTNNLPELTVNWLMGVAIWFVDDKTFFQNKDKDNMAYRISLAKYDTWAQNYGSMYSREIDSIMKKSDVNLNEVVLNFVYQEKEMHMSLFDDYKKLYIQEGHSGKATQGGVYVLESAEAVMRKDHTLMTSELIQKLLQMWYSNTLYCETFSVRDSMTHLFGLYIRRDSRHHEDVFMI